MNFAILVKASPFTSLMQETALRFAEAVLAKNHQLTTLFFYHDAVFTADIKQSDQYLIELRQRWQQLVNDLNIPLKVCVTALERRGVKDNELATGFMLSSLSQWTEAMLQVDRVVAFENYEKNHVRQ